MHKVLLFLWRIRLWILLVLVVGAGGVWWWRGAKAKEQPVKTVHPAYMDIAQKLTVSGSIDAQEKAILKFPAPSLLTWVGVKEGEAVKKWQGVAKVDTRTLQKQMQIAMNTQGKTFRSFEQTLDNMDYYDGSGLNETERRSAENAQLDLRSSVLNVEIADLAVKLAYMYSPINGIVVKIDQPNVGSTISPTDTFVIVNPQSIFFGAIVDEEDIRQITLGQSAQITLDAYAENALQGQVFDIAFSPSQSESGGTGYRIKIRVPADNANRQFKLGMNGDAAILLDEQKQVLAIPTDSLIEREGKTYVDVWRNNKKEQVEITTGITNEEFVAVTSGLSVEDNVVLPL